MISRIVALTLSIPLTLSVLAQSPCNSDVHYRQFDFWVGNWDVYKYGTDTLAGSNEVVKLLDDCVVQENWKSANSDFAGKSYNSYDPITDKWRQTWVDNKGRTLRFEGSFRDGKMQMTGFSYEKNKKLVYYKMVFTKMQDGTVRQQWEKSYNREDWESIFDGHYVPKGSGPRVK